MSYDYNYPPDDQPRSVPGLGPARYYESDLAALERTGHVTYEFAQSECGRHRFSTLYEKHPTCLDCGGKKCDAPGCQHLAWSHSEDWWCPQHEAECDLEQFHAFTRDGEPVWALESLLWAHAASQNIAPAGGGRWMRKGEL